MTESGLATGISLAGGVTVIDTIAVLLVAPLLSLIVYVNESDVVFEPSWD